MTDLIVRVSDGVALLTLNRPERRNAYTDDEFDDQDGEETA